MSQDSVIGSITDSQSLNRYVYCGGNPVMYVDPTGEFGVIATTALMIVGGGVVSMAGRFVGDLISGESSTWQDYVGSFIGGATGTATGLFGGGLIASNFVGSAVENITIQGLNYLSINNYEFDIENTVANTLSSTISGVMGGKIMSKAFPAGQHAIALDSFENIQKFIGQVNTSYVFQEAFADILPEQVISASVENLPKRVIKGIIGSEK